MAASQSHTHRTAENLTKAIKCPLKKKEGGDDEQPKPSQISLKLRMKAYPVHGRICRHLQGRLPGPTLTSQARWLLLTNAGNDKPERHPLMLLSSEPLMVETGHSTVAEVGMWERDSVCMQVSKDRTWKQSCIWKVKFPEMRGCGRTRIPWPGVKMHSTALQCHTEQKVPLATQRLVDFSADLPSNKGYLVVGTRAVLL